MDFTHSPIFGVEFKQLKSFPDQRGFFREIIRFSDPFFAGGKFGQWSHSKMTKNVVKAWHYHHVQTDWWYVGMGEIEAVLYDNREESPTFKIKCAFPMGDNSPVCVKIPPGVLHGLKVQSEEAHLFYITSETYNPNDEGRFSFDSTFVGHNWGTEAITVENDRRNFQPTSTRTLCRT